MARKSPPFPPGTVLQDWYIHLESENNPRIKRYAVLPDGKRRNQRHPIEKYKHLLNDPKELADYVLRLNGSDPFKKRAREVTDLRHAFASREILDKYYTEVLRTAIASEKDARTAHKYLVEYGIHFFAVKLDVPNPIDWEAHQFSWGRSLLNREDDEIPENLRIFPAGAIKSAKVLRYIVWEVNRLTALASLEITRKISLLVQ